jgi:hypothetical protein
MARDEDRKHKEGMRDKDLDEDVERRGQRGAEETGDEDRI